MERAFNYAVKKIAKIFPGQWLQKRVSSANRATVVNWYTFGKVLLSLILLIFSLYTYPYLWMLSLYLIIETLNYNTYHIFQAKNFTHKKSLTRNILLGVLNYVEIALNFAFLYGASDSIQRSTTIDADKGLNSLDYIYFSVVTGATVGYGDMIATGTFGHLLVISQILIFIMFVTIFITYNLSLFINNIQAE